MRMAAESARRSCSVNRANIHDGFIKRSRGAPSHVTSWQRTRPLSFRGRRAIKSTLSWMALKRSLTAAQTAKSPFTRSVSAFRFASRERRELLRRAVVHEDEGAHALRCEVRAREVRRDMEPVAHPVHSRTLMNPQQFFHILFFFVFNALATSACARSTSGSRCNAS